MKAVDYTGRRFGRLTVEHRSGSAYGSPLWRCVCDCGALKIVSSANLRLGKSRSCGCLAKEALRARSVSHGQSKTRLYGIWKTMRNRCQKPSVPGFADYGGRGIAVCPAWESYPAFHEWAMGAGYEVGLSIERLDVDGNYCPANCTWIPRGAQSYNRRDTKRAPDGRAWVQIAKANGIPSPAFNNRLGLGWEIEWAATWPMGRHTERYLKRPRSTDGRFAG